MIVIAILISCAVHGGDCVVTSTKITASDCVQVRRMLAMDAVFMGRGGLRLGRAYCIPTMVSP